MSIRAIERRLGNLTKRHRFLVPPPPTPEDLQFAEILEDLLSRISPKYAAPVVREFNARGLAGCSDFALEVIRVALGHFEEGRPLAFPDEVAEAYLNGRKLPGREFCIECRYQLPVGCFTQCPLCAGKVGY